MTWRERLANLRRTWITRKPEGRLVGASVGWNKPDCKRGRIVNGNGVVEHVRRLSHKTKGEAWSKNV